MANMNASGPKNRQKIDISTRTIFKIIMAVLGLWFVYLVRDVISLLLISIIIVAAIDPLIDRLQEKKVPRTAGVLLVYLVLILFAGLALSFLVPPLVSQLKDFAQNFPEYFERFQDFLGPVKNFLGAQNFDVGTQEFLNNISNSLSNISRNIFATTFGVFSGLVAAIAVLSLAFYMSVDEEGMEKFIMSLVPRKNHKYTADLVTRIKTKIGKWLQGQVLLMIVIFAITSIGLYIIGVPYPLILGAFAGLMEIIPYIGPIIAAVPGVILGFIVSPLTGILALAVYVVSQQLENHVLTPLIMKKTVGLNPVVVILAILIGAKLGGVLGAVLAIPVSAALGLVFRDFINRNET